MIKNLEANLYENTLDDFWYDVQMDIVINILNEFSKQDWEKLKNKLPFENENKNQA